jgi:hypothetical protein
MSADDDAGVLTTEQAARSLWIGDLPPWADESFLAGLFAPTGALAGVRLARGGRPGGPADGSAFLEFASHEAAAGALRAYAGAPLPGCYAPPRLAWAAAGLGRAAPAGEDHSLFVGDLAPDVSDLILQEYFRQFYPSVRSAKVIADAASARSKGYGFVRFGAAAERDAALAEMAGHFLSNRPIRVSLATARRAAAPSGGAGAAAAAAPHPSDYDPANTTLFVGGLAPGVGEPGLRAAFGRFGDIVYVKAPAGKGCGFVQFVLRAAAERAMAAMHGAPLGGAPVRVSWGRSSSRAAAQAAQLAALAGLGPGGDPAAALAAAAAAAGGFAGLPGLPGGYGHAPSHGHHHGGHHHHLHHPAAAFGLDPALFAAALAAGGGGGPRGGGPAPGAPHLLADGGAAPHDPGAAAAAAAAAALYGYGYGGSGGGGHQAAYGHGYGAAAAAHAGFGPPGGGAPGGGGGGGGVDEYLFGGGGSGGGGGGGGGGGAPESGAAPAEAPRVAPVEAVAPEAAGSPPRPRSAAGSDAAAPPAGGSSAPGSDGGASERGASPPGAPPADSAAAAGAALSALVLAD